MEASQSGSPDAGAGDAQISQEQPTQDSGLTTPQPDQPIPTEAERQEQNTENPGGSTATTPGPSGEPAEGVVAGTAIGENPFPGTADPVGPTDAEQVEAHRAKESAVEAQRRTHNERTGGADIAEGERQAQREEHNARVAGDSSASQSEPAPSDSADASQDEA